MEEIKDLIENNQEIKKLIKENPQTEQSWLQWVVDIITNNGKEMV